MQHDTTGVIVEGAMRALARHGVSRVSMTDIYRESQVSAARCTDTSPTAKPYSTRSTRKS